MRVSWADPDDIRPSARHTARQVAGFRSYCPIRWSIRRHGSASAYNERHVYAADRLRLAYDLATLGASPAFDIQAVQAAMYRPMSGPSAPSIARVRAIREVNRVLDLYALDDRKLLIATVVMNFSISAWCASQYPKVSPALRARESQRLLRVLDALEEHYRSEIDEDVAMGRVVGI